MDGIFSKLKSLNSSGFPKFEISEFTIRKLQESNRNLDNILKNSGTIGQPKVDHFKQVLTYFYDNEHRDRYFTNSLSIKRLCWALDYTDEEFPESILEKGQLVLALGYIDKYFSSSCLTALIFILFNKWQSSKVDFLRDYLRNRIIAEKNERPKLKYYRENIDYLCQKDGPIRWSQDSFKTYQGIIDLFFESNPYISYAKGTQYFKLFLIEMFENTVRNAILSERENWKGILDFAKENFERNLHKYLVSAEIVRFKDEIKGSTFQDVIKNEAFEYIGDPGKESNWVLPSSEFSTYQIQVVQEARQILNIWINESLVDLFFSEVVEDLPRKRFWMNYVSKMTTVDIFLSSQKLEEIFNDSRVKNGMEQRFGVLSSGGSTSSVIIFTIKKYRFVLAGSLAGGALYVHPDSSTLYPRIEELRNEWPVLGRRLRRLDRGLLIHSYLRNLISENNNYLYFENEGRMVHTGNWQYRLRKWMNKKVE